MSWTAYKPENDANPYDWFGLYHNQSLDYVSSGFFKLQLKGPGGVSVLLEVAKMISDFLYLKAADKEYDIAVREEILNACYVAVGNVISSRNVFPLVKTKSTKDYFDYYVGLRELLPYTTLENIDRTMTQIRAHEATISPSGMTEVDKRNAYWISSVARYSLAYWISEFSAERSLWVEAASRINGWDGLVLKAAAGPPQWVTDDIEGALIGAFFYC